MKKIDLSNLVYVEKIPGVYVITHVKTGMMYIGSTGNLYGRINYHRSALRKGVHSNYNLQKIYNEDSEIKFTVYLTSSREDAYDEEQRMIKSDFNKDKIVNLYSLNKPVPVFKESKRVTKAVSINGVVYLNVNDACKKLVLSKAVINGRIRNPREQYRDWFFL